MDGVIAFYASWIDCRCRVLLEIPVDRGFHSEGWGSRSLEIRASRETVTRAAQTERRDRREDSLAEVTSRPLDSQMSSDWICGMV